MILKIFYDEPIKIILKFIYNFVYFKNLIRIYKFLGKLSKC